MLNKLKAVLAPKQTSAPSGSDGADTAAAQAFFGEQIAPPPAIEAPQAANDDPLEPLREEVERALKRAGYLR